MRCFSKMIQYLNSLFHKMAAVVRDGGSSHFGIYDYIYKYFKNLYCQKVVYKWSTEKIFFSLYTKPKFEISYKIEVMFNYAIKLSIIGP